MKHILIVGIGTGNPEHITIQAVNALNSADVLFIPVKGEEKAELADVRREICARYVTSSQSRIVEFAVPVRRVAKDRSYVESVDEWHAAIAGVYERLFADHLPDGKTGAFLVWGDPGLYDSTIRIIERVREGGRIDFDYRVIPGITSLQVLCAQHRIPLNLVGKPVEITTGRRLHESFTSRSSTSAVMLDGEQAFAAIDDAEAEIFWGAYLGMPNETLIEGRLADVKDKILEARRRLREENGWIMDIYLLRKGRDFET